MKYWYAVMVDREDIDWGYGSFDLDEAKEMCKERDYYCVDVVEEGDDPICVKELINGIDF